MIELLLRWAAAFWYEFESRLTVLSLARDGGPVRALDLSPQHFINAIEGIIREDPDRSNKMTEIYAEAAEIATEKARLARMTPEEILAEKRAKRRAEIAATRAAFGK